MAYTSIDDPSAYFQVATYSGSGGSGGHAIVNDGNSDLQPDWVWLKQRSYASSSRLMDSSRGGNKMIESDTGAAETTYGYISSFDTDGFTLGYSDNSFDGYGRNYVGWQWKANGGTTSSNTDGTTTTTVQANTTAGFSIVLGSFTGSTKTYGHGLGVAPDVVFWKNRSNTNSWLLFTTVVDGTHDYGILNQGNNFSATGYDVPTSTVFYGNDDASTDFVAYCFKSIQGYSKIGSYTGNGNAEGPFVYTGFKPAWLMIKNTTTTGNSWAIFDNKRSDVVGANQIDKEIAANENSAEYDRTNANMDFLSNGFKLRNTDGWHNTSGDKYFYMAFAENPFVTSTGIPTTAR